MNDRGCAPVEMAGREVWEILGRSRGSKSSYRGTKVWRIEDEDVSCSWFEVRKHNVEQQDLVTNESWTRSGAFVDCQICMYVQGAMASMLAEEELRKVLFFVSD